MHLLKSAGDSTLQVFESCFSFKTDQEMKMPEQTLISTLHWIKQGETVLLSGTNMPVTALQLNRSEDRGIVTYSIGKAD